MAVEPLGKPSAAPVCWSALEIRVGFSRDMETTMAVNTRRVTDRRAVRYESFHELLADAETLAQSEVLTLGNWSLGQIFLHLARTMHASMEGFEANASWWSRLASRFVHGRRMLMGPMPAGIHLPRAAAEQLLPDAVSAEEGFAALREAIDRLNFETERAAHPLLGEMSLDQWDNYHLRHAELHLSFALPIDVPVLV